MKVQEKNKEQQILEAAEVVFVERGFANAKTTEIAKRAGVTHAMLHYYFRTKDNLFEMVFQRKFDQFVSTLLVSFDQNLPFEERLKQAIGNHFDLIAANPRLPSFIFGEIVSNDERRGVVIQALRPKVYKMKERFTNELKEEIAKGSIRPIDPVDLVLDIISLNAFLFVVQPLINDLLHLDPEQQQELIQRRREHNVEVILASLKK